jgi:hypothetical protein
MLGATGATLTDAMFESVSRFTTTGGTVFVGLEEVGAWPFHHRLLA